MHDLRGQTNMHTRIGMETATTAQLYLVNPPEIKGRTNERAHSGGCGVSRQLNPSEEKRADVLPHDFLYLVIDSRVV